MCIVCDDFNDCLRDMCISYASFLPSYLILLQDESGNFHGSTNSTKIIPEEFDLSQLQSALILQHPNFVEQFQSSTLLQPSKNDYADTQSTNTLLRAHRQMIRLRKMDTILQDVHRQGRISFYMTCTGTYIL